MAVYEFACPDCGSVQASFPMGTAPESVPCPGCSGPAGRVFSAPHLSIAGKTAYKLIDATEKTAHEPQVVAGLPAAGGMRRPTRYTANPLHQKLPRP